MDVTAVDTAPIAGILMFIPMLIFGVLYVAFLIAFVWGFFSMVRSQKRVASAQEETLGILKEIVMALRARQWPRGLGNNTVLNIDTRDKREQRKFGLGMAAIIAALGLIRWAFHGFEALPANFFIVAAVFLVPGLLFPKALQPVFYLWMKLAVVLNFIMMHLLLALAFYLMITPVRVLRHFISEDSLKRAWLPSADSYWDDAQEQPEAFERYRKQY